MHAQTTRTDRLPLKARQHHLVLDLAVLLLLQFFEESMQSAEVFISGPDQLFLLRRQGIERRVDREIELRRIVDQRLQPFALHGFALPTRNRLLVDRLRLIRHDQILINTHHLAYALTFGTGTQGIIEVEQVLARFNELYPVCLKVLRENIRLRYIALLHDHLAFALPLKERCLYAVCKAVAGRLLMVHYDTIDQQIGLMALRLLPSRIIQTHRIAIDHQATETLTHPQGQLLFQGPAFRQYDRTQQVQTCSNGLLLHVAHHIADGVFLHLFPAHGRVRFAYARVQ